MVKAWLITNPRSGRGRIDLTEAVTVLSAQGWDIQVREKRHGGQATELARAAVQAGCDVVVACAGDGTVSEIVDGLVGTEVAVGVLPGGTANLWAHELGVSSKLEVAARQLAGAQRRRVDVGHVQVNGRHGQHFLLMAGLGLDGAVMAHLSKPLKRRIGKLAVGVAALRTLPAYHAVEVHAEIDGLAWDGKVSQVTIGNTRRYGGFTQITGDAYIDDGMLDICLFEAMSPAAAGRQLASLLLRQHPSRESAESHRAASLTLEAPCVLPLQIDGGAVRLKKVKPKQGRVTYSFTTVAGGITMLIPRDYAGALFQHDALLTTPSSGPTSPAGTEALSGKSSHGRHRKQGGRHYTVLVVGVDTLTVQRVGKGLVMTVLVTPDTQVDGLEDGANGATSPLLGGFQAGDLVRLKGKKNKQHTSIRARRVTLLPGTRPV